jgi:hypothetical protein
MTSDNHKDFVFRNYSIHDVKGHMCFICKSRSPEDVTTVTEQINAAAVPHSHSKSTRFEVRWRTCCPDMFSVFQYVRPSTDLDTPVYRTQLPSTGTFGHSGIQNTASFHRHIWTLQYTEHSFLPQT